MSLPILLFYGFAFVGIVHSCLFSFLAIRNRKTADLLITIFLFVQSIIILEYIFYWTGWQLKYHQLTNISMTLQFLFGPLLFMYVDFVLIEKKKSKVYWLHFTPAIIVFLLMMPYYLSTADLKLFHYRMIKYFVVDIRLLNYFLIIHMAFYCAYLMVKISNEKRVGHIKNWLLTIVGLFGFYIASYVSYFVMVRYAWFNLTTDYFVSIGMCASIVAIIYFAYGKNKILDGFAVAESLNLENFYFSYKSSEKENTLDKKKDHPLVYNYATAFDKKKTETSVLGAIAEEKTPAAKFIDATPSIKYKNSGLTTDAGNELAESLHQLMQKEKLYRESELKLETLSATLGIPKHYVSQIINQHYGVNFFEYINLLRIEEAKQLLTAPDKQSLNIIEVAYAVGYNTKNTFNNAFRRIVGITPTEYRNQNQIRMN